MKGHTESAQAWKTHVYVASSKNINTTIWDEMQHFERFLCIKNSTSWKMFFFCHSFLYGMKRLLLFLPVCERRQQMMRGKIQETLWNNNETRKKSMGWGQVSTLSSRVWTSEASATKPPAHPHIWRVFGRLMRSICCSGSATLAAPRQPHSAEGLHLR